MYTKSATKHKQTIYFRMGFQPSGKAKSQILAWIKNYKYAHALLPFRMEFSALFKESSFKEHVICIFSLFCSSFENKENRKLLYFYAYATFTISS